MSKVRCEITMSLDAYVAGPDQRPDEPLGTGGEELHRWMFEKPTDADAEAVERIADGVGAYVMGRNMFAGPGPWDESWKGWWGDDPPYHVPVFVLTHHERAPQPMEGGTTFHFVNDGIDSALSQAREAAGDRDVSIAGGASTVNQYLAAGAIEQLDLHIAPILLGGGERLFEGVDGVAFEPIEAQTSPLATHVRYRVSR